MTSSRVTKYLIVSFGRQCHIIREFYDMNTEDFKHLILLIGINPLPNFVVAEYFLKQNPKIQKIWLVHSEQNKLQAGTDTQAKYLEDVLHTRWKHHQSLRFP